jgi:hypothetical protein
MKARLATIFTLLALVGGTGGALAIAASGGSGQATSAAVSQYKPHKKKGCKIDGHFYKKCPKRYPHHFHCRFRHHYYKRCPYGRHVKGVHVVRTRRKPVFTG